jgi:hypothetical protein
MSPKGLLDGSKDLVGFGNAFDVSSCQNPSPHGPPRNVEDLEKGLAPRVVLRRRDEPVLGIRGGASNPRVGPAQTPGRKTEAGTRSPHSREAEGHDRQAVSPARPLEIGSASEKG